MGHYWILWLSVFCLVIPLILTLDQASFYGRSYVFIPFQEAKSSTDVHFKLRTHLSNALILLVAGMTDYCIVGLDNGRLKVNINLGAGESELLSSGDVVLNDFKWHDVLISRKEANMSIIIDNKYRVTDKLRGKFFELNVHYGLFLGGRGNFSELFFGHSDTFRGCLSEVMYNGALVLDQARHRQLQAVVDGVTWNCAAEFNASKKDPISFVKDKAFMMLPYRPTQNQMKIELELKTLMENSTLIYNAGPLSKSDFFAVELRKGNIRCTLKHLDKVVVVTNSLYISDGHWHKIYVHVTSNSLELNVDSNLESIKKLRNHIIDFSDSIYVGGVEKSKRGRAMAKGLETSDSSFKGCLQHLVISDRHLGFPDVRISEGLLSGCIWQYPCLNKPCIPTATCHQQGLDSFHCQCNEELCIDSNYTQEYKVFSHGNLASELQLFFLQPLEVVEGASAVITANNLHVAFDYPKYGILDSGISFSIVEAPTYGSITIDIWPHERNIFTLEDVLRDKVYYVHDGSEITHDRVILDVEFLATERYVLPAYLQGKFRFILAVKVQLVNDPPVLEFSSAAVLKLVQGSRTVVDSKLLKVDDPDSTPDQLIFTVIDAGPGHFEYANKLDVPILTFSLEDVHKGKVTYIHNKRGANESYVSMQVSDGIETSSVSRLRVSAIPQYWRLQNNTGLTLLYGTWALITPYNLSFVSNVASTGSEPQFEIVYGPQFGTIEVDNDVGMWKRSTVFMNTELKQHRVRYRHLTSKPDFDEFQFRNTLNTSTTYSFRITFAKCMLHKTKSDTLVLNASSEAVITLPHLEYQTEPLKSATTSIIFQIIQPPQFGYLFFGVSKYRMRTGDTFSQEDLSSSNLKYRLHHTSYSIVQDAVFYTVNAPGCKNITGNISIIYYPSNDLLVKVRVTTERLHVEEGAKVSLGLSHLNIQSSFVTDLVFNITQPPEHGILQIDTNGNVENGTDVFTLYELRSGQIFYIHDGSESRHDSFKFLALSGDVDFQYVGLFYIDILLKNDNSPVRTIDKLFHVVVGGKRLITGDDLKYSDADIDTKPSDIVYTSREVSNGEIFNIDDLSTRITQFTQEDLDSRKILFKHTGSEYGKIKLWITDGQFYVNSALEVQASAPFIHVFTNKKLIVQHGKTARITEEHLSYKTNLYAFDADVIYEVVAAPTFGRIVNSAKLKTLSDFSHVDVIAGSVSYVHELSATDADEIKLRVKCKDAISAAQIGVWMLPASYWEPLITKNLRTLVVEESTSALINKNTLQVVQPEVPATAIVYYIHSMPENGYISILSNSDKSEEQITNTASFTQAMINENRVLYIQAGANRTADRIIFNVTNGIVWLHYLTLEIQIIPEHLYLGSSILTVHEGGVSILSSAHLFVLTEYYKLQLTDYMIVKEPSHGCVQIYKRCNKRNTFSQKELLADVVYYAHDGTENLSDEISVVAVAGEKRSIPITVYINVVPINDQKPILVNNTGLTMWEGGAAVITNEMLAFSDADQPRDTLQFHVLRCWWGNVSMLNSSESLQFFTQQLIDKNLIVFHHQNGSEAKFTFTVSDGLHTTKEFSFHIRTKPIILKLQTKAFHIFPLQKKYLTSSHLLVTVSDPSRSVIYEIIKPPSLGHLMMESEQGGVFKQVSAFSQNDLNESKVFYEHTHPFVNLYMNDSFIFNAKSHLAEPLLNKIMTIDISVSSGGLDAYVNVPKITVDEGGMTSIVLNFSGVVSFLEDHAGLQSPIIHVSTTIPQHGQVFLQHLPNTTVFTKQQLESGQVHYQHDHSDTLADNIYMSLFLLPGYITLCNITIPVTVNPINDQAFHLVTPAPHISVIQGENYTISKTELLTEDADTDASDIVYALFTGPFEGILILLPNAVPITQFTQADINENRLVYIHNSSALTDQFHLRVWDGKFRPEYLVFNIRVVPVYVNISVGLPVYLQQGSNVAMLSDKQFFLETNTNKAKVQFRVKEGPKHGVLYVKDKTATEFYQNDLDSQSVMYMQTDMTTANDSFKVFVGINASLGNEVEVIIQVQPLMQFGNFTAIIGESNRISLDVLDATPLAKLTNSNPLYTITMYPRYGQVRKMIRSSGEQRNILNTLISSFTHEEVQRGLIFLSIQDDAVKEYQDQLGFMLAASIFQPALGMLKIHLRPSISNDVFPTLAGPSDPAGHEGGMHFATPSMTKDYLFIVSIVSGVVVLGIVIMVIIKYRYLDPNEMKKEQPSPLPRPPDGLLLSTGLLKQTVQDNYSATLPAALPHCKVTPLNRTDVDSHSCYPYGVDEHPDDWSSYEASDPACSSRNIMLRRNQYWV